VQRRDQNACRRVERSAAADPDGRDVGAGIFHRLPPEREEPPHAVLRPSRGLGRRNSEAFDAPVGIDDPGGELRAADVEPENWRSYPFLP
jgi:hypothetical protein